MERYQVTITGKTALLMHADNIAWADKMERWKGDPANKKSSKAGDDRTPAYRWLGYLYHDDQSICLPYDNLMRCLMEGGALVPVPSGKNGKTFKAQTQSGCQIGEAFWPVLVQGQPILVEPLLQLEHQPDYDAHQEVVHDAGFMLFLKRAKVGQSKHIRVRPRFDQWVVAGTIIVQDEQITQEILQTILTYAGTYKGLGDWRPSSRTPGPYGTFTATVAALKD
jgi:hypothetical protein